MNDFTNQNTYINMIYLGNYARGVMEHMKYPIDNRFFLLQLDSFSGIAEHKKQLTTFSFINFILIDAGHITAESVSFLCELSLRSLTLIFVFGTVLNESLRELMIETTRSFFLVDCFDEVEEYTSSVISRIIQGFDGTSVFPIDRQDLRQGLVNPHNELFYFKIIGKDRVFSFVNQVKKTNLSMIPKKSKGNVLVYFDGDIAILDVADIFKDIIGRINCENSVLSVRGNYNEEPSVLIIMSY